jgi:hypothetical protein
MGFSHDCPFHRSKKHGVQVHHPGRLAKMLFMSPVSGQTALNLFMQPSATPATSSNGIIIFINAKQNFLA